jgi:hypothetical protein
VQDQPPPLAVNAEGVDDVVMDGWLGSHNVKPIGSRAGAVLAPEPRQAYPPARSTASAGYVPARSGAASVAFR